MPKRVISICRMTSIFKLRGDPTFSPFPRHYTRDGRPITIHQLAYSFESPFNFLSPFLPPTFAASNTSRINSSGLIPLIR